MWQQSNTMNKRFMEQNKIMWWYILVHTKKLWMIVFGNWNKTRTNSFLEMGKSSSNVSNVFKGSSLTGGHVYWRVPIFNTFFNIFSFTVHIQRLWMEITNSALFSEIFISQKWIFLPSWRVPQNLDNPKNGWTFKPLLSIGQLTLVWSRQHCKHSAI